MAETEHLDAAVPLSKRRSFFEVTAVWIGFVIAVGTMATGGVIGQRLPFDQLAILVIGGNAILGLFAAFGGYIGARSGLSFNLLLRKAFPGAWSRVASLYVPLILIGWYAIVSSVLANYAVLRLGLDPAWRFPVASLACIVMSVSAWVGFRGLALLSYVMVPLLIVLGSFAVLGRPFNPLAPDTAPLSLSTVNEILGLVIGTWIMGAIVNLQDITRYARSPAQGAIAGFVGIFVGNCFNLLVGAAAFRISGDSDPATVLLVLGFSIPAAILVVANVWNVNDNNMYSATLNLAHALKLRRQIAVCIGVAIAAVAVWWDLGSIEAIITALVIMGSTAPALGAVVITRHLFDDDQLAGVSESLQALLALLCWAVGALVAYFLGGLVGIVGSMVIAGATYLLGLRLMAAGRAGRAAT